MPDFIIRIMKQVVVLQKVEERVIQAPSLASAQREAAFILGEEYPMKEDIVAETEEKTGESKKPSEEAPF
jgi:hypothetical protein